MYRTPLLALSLLLPVLVLSSCSTNLKKVDDKDSSYIMALRSEYFASNPDGQYNEYIKNSEVVKGMDFLEVLSSWGHPSSRLRKSETTELWTYREMEEVNQDWIEYTFTFRSSILGDWTIARHTSQGAVDFPQSHETAIRKEYTSGKRVP